MILSPAFFAQPPVALARALLGKVIRHKVGEQWLAVRIIETEAYDVRDRGSHASLGFTEKRRGLFMPPGILYMYYARGKDSLNFSAEGEGNGVLIKSAIPWQDSLSEAASLRMMQALNPKTDGTARPLHKLCSGQTLVCKALGLKVSEWDQQPQDPQRLRVEDIGYQPERILQAPRLGIPSGRDEHLLWRFIDASDVRSCTQNPLTRPQIPCHELTAAMPSVISEPG
ncbi:DNA-3-methyladenine glycosylase [Pokkaliibacter sp. CJK22405]|uniref:DNA-3-methyladenine glycosylase n=1 Tax=Pokkaliibacter sp. CJK22405 TaxID=3384615 RepID=UPI0039850D3F